MSFLKNHTESESKGKQLFTGVANMNVIAINPTVEELSKIYNTDNVSEPTYVTENNNGNTKVRLDFFLQNEENGIITSFPIWLENEARVSAAGNNQFINRKVQSTWSTSLEDLAENEKMSWFDITTARQAKSGEVDLYDFLVKWTNAQTGESVDLELSNFENLIAKGDVSELKEIMLKIGKTVNVLLGVREGQYQSVYTKYVNRGHIASVKGFEKNLDDEYGEFKSDYSNSLELKLYVEQTAPETTTNEYSNADILEEDDEDLF